LDSISPDRFQDGFVEQDFVARESSDLLNAKGISKQRHELSKKLQDLHIDVALFSEIHLKPYERFYIPNYHFYRIDRHPGRKSEKASPTSM
jgi:hypothetical protein